MCYLHAKIIVQKVYFKIIMTNMSLSTDRKKIIKIFGFFFLTLYNVSGTIASGNLTPIRE
jgi:hypothetical protein